MGRRLTAVPAVEDAPSCLLCAGPAHVVSQTADEVITWDLCAPCDAVFQLTAARVAATVVLTVDGGTAEALVQVAGQLELDD